MPIDKIKPLLEVTLDMTVTKVSGPFPASIEYLNPETLADLKARSVIIEVDGVWCWNRPLEGDA